MASPDSRALHQLDGTGSDATAEFKRGAPRTRPDGMAEYPPQRKPPASTTSVAGELSAACREADCDAGRPERQAEATPPSEAEPGSTQSRHQLDATSDVTATEREQIAPGEFKPHRPAHSPDESPLDGREAGPAERFKQRALSGVATNGSPRPPPTENDSETQAGAEHELRGESITRQLRNHMCRPDLSGWGFAQAAELFHKLATEIDREFQWNIEVPTIELEERSTRTLTTYRGGRDGLALRHHIRINTAYIHNGARATLQLLASFFLSLLRAKRSAAPGVGALQREAALYGLRLSKSGKLIKVQEGLFTEFLHKLHIEIDPKHVDSDFDERTPGQKSRLYLFLCSCDPPWRIRCGRKDLDAICQRCKQLFQRRESQMN